jgi:hypothetical protein
VRTAYCLRCSSPRSDAAELALFAVAGAQKALNFGIEPFERDADCSNQRRLMPFARIS